MHMRSFKLPSTLLASLAAAGALAGGILMTPPSTSADESVLLIQDEPEQKKPFNITGVAIGPDGAPAAKLPVVVKVPNKVLQSAGGGGGGAPPPELLVQKKAPDADMFKTVAKGITDESGRFTLKVQPQNGGVVQLEIGDKMKSAWIIKPLKVEGKDIDLKEIQLNKKI
jgi:hypothetical protein